jgi:hypothetical protein
MYELIQSQCIKKCFVISAWDIVLYDPLLSLQIRVRLFYSYISWEKCLDRGEVWGLVLESHWLQSTPVAGYRPKHKSLDKLPRSSKTNNLPRPEWLGIGFLVYHGFRDYSTYRGKIWQPNNPRPPQSFRGVRVSRNSCRSATPSGLDTLMKTLF